MKNIIKIITISCLPLLSQAQTLYNNGATLFVSAGDTLQVNGNMQTQSGSTFANNGIVRVLGNVTNNATMAMPNAGTLAFVGTTAQTLDGSAAYFANHVLVNNANGVTLNTPLKVDGNATFYNGIVNAPNSSQALLFTANGTHSNAGNTSHVLGYVVKEGTGAFTYPVGNGTTYEPMDINLTANATGMQVNYNETDAGAGAYSTTGTDATPLVAVNHLEHWQATPLSTATGSVTMYWNAHNNVGISNVSDLRVAHLTGGNWLNEGATATSGNATAGTVTSNSISTWSPFTLGSISMNSPLPVSLLSFTGKKEGTTNVLHWITSSEQNNDYFTVQKSNDAQHFSELGVVQTKAMQGNSSTTLYYELIDNNPSVGHTYYRLLQTDIDGKPTTEAKVIDLYRDANGSVVNVYPIPTSSVLNIELSTNNSQRTIIKLSDLFGRIIKEMQATSTKGTNNIQLDMNEVATGMYMLQVFQNNQVIFMQKVEKK